MARLGAGYDMGPIADEMVRTNGVRGAMRLMKLGGDVTKSLTDGLGDYTAQILIGIAALWNGCRYCSIGHIYSANLFWFENEGALGTFDENELIGLMYMTDDESYEELKKMFAGPEHARTWHLIDRMFQLRFRELDPSEETDDLLKAALAYWDWLNECTIILGIDAKPGNVPALGYMHPSAELIEKYGRAREEARAKKLESSVM
jgi:hypothetical protein